MLSPSSHLVLGGSRGIGFAYAASFAKQRAAIFLVARDAADLQAARARLLELGAASVTIVPGDLVSLDFRGSLVAQLSGMHFQGVLVGGPSPPVGRVEQVTLSDRERARAICLDYPMEVVTWMCEGQITADRLTIVGSSASTEPLEGHRFYLSALYRRELDAALARCAFLKAIHLEIWRPKVVVSRLSARFATGHLETDETDPTVADRLSTIFGLEHVPSAAEFVAERLGTR